MRPVLVALDPHGSTSVIREFRHSGGAHLEGIPYVVVENCQAQAQVQLAAVVVAGAVPVLGSHSLADKCQAVDGVL